MRYRKASIGGVELFVSVPESLAQRVRKFRGAGHDDVAAANPPAAQTISEPGSHADRISRLEWYHTIDLGDGLVTPGTFDHRPYLHHYPIPERLDGMRVLDVATFDGFFAFEMERRGAAEVVAIDVDNFDAVDLAPSVRRTISPEALKRKPGEGFQICHEILKSKVRREPVSVYELSPEKLGKFDLVFMGDLLLHLNNPIKALQNIASMTAGTAVLVDVFHPVIPDKLISYESGTTNTTWWLMSYGALDQMIRDAGFSKVEAMGKFSAPCGKGGSILWRGAFRAAG